MDIYQTVSHFYDVVKTEKRIIGKTCFGRSMYAIKLGNGTPIGIAQYAIHGREFITSMLAISQYEQGLQRGSCWFIPLLNPDGALLSQRGLSTVLNSSARTRLCALNKNEDFSLWKANGRGVDLNVNFPAKWGRGVRNGRVPGPENYIGSRPFSELETRALKKFTEEICPDYTISYHTKGEEIYWYFHQSRRLCLRDFSLAKRLAKSTGYTLASAGNSVGGYKDWCIQHLGIPSFTVEVGKDSLSHPLREEALADILTKNRWALYELSKEF